MAVIKNRIASVLARLRNKAIEIGTSYQQVLLLFCQEEFLRRLERSRYADNLVLKGGLFLYFLTSFSSRSTRDADFLLCCHDNSAASIKHMLQLIVDTKSENDFVTYEIRHLKPIALNQNYQGIQASLFARINNIRVPLFMDFGVGDKIVPSPIRRKLSTMLKENGAPSVLTYSVESTIAEKYDAIVQRKSETSRMKDFYDLYHLSKLFAFEGATLQEAIRQTLLYRGTLHHAGTFEEIESLKNNGDMQNKWQLFVRALSPSDNKVMSFEAVMDGVSAFLKPVVLSIENQCQWSGYWTPDAGWGNR